MEIKNSRSVFKRLLKVTNGNHTRVERHKGYNEIITKFVQQVRLYNRN